MPMAKLAGETRSGLAAVLPSFATTTNPVDITAALLSNSGLFSDILPVLARDPAADAFLIGIPVSGQGYDVDAFTRDTAAFARQTGKPVVMAMPQPSIAAKFKAVGLPVFAAETDAIAALNQFLSHHELMQRTSTPRMPATIGRAGEPRMLNEAESLALLARYGVPVVEHRLCKSAGEAVEALEALGAPVVAKGCSADVVHKSELGVVRLGLTEPGQVRDTFADIERRLREAGMRFDGVIIAKMARGRRELMLGARVDPIFGPVVVVGDGGKYVEALPDVQLLLPPFDATEVQRALSRLRIAPLFAGVRGEPPLDVASFADAAVAIGTLMTDPSAGVVNLDLNPVLVGAAGERCVALDAVVYTLRGA